MLKAIFLLTLIGFQLQAKPRDSKAVFGLLEKGRKLNAEDAGKLEARLEKKEKDEDARIQLLAYYALPPAGVDLAEVKKSRARHIFWLIENDPSEGLGLFQVATRVYSLNCTGDDLSDAISQARSMELWAAQGKKYPESASIAERTVEASMYCAPEQTEKLLFERKDARNLGRLYASAALGITGVGYATSDPTGTDAKLRETPFAQKARKVLQEAQNKEFLVEAATRILRDGAILWADGKLDWDNTALGNQLLEKAQRAAPDELRLYTLPTKLPARGERPPATLRVGGNVQQSLITRSVPPRYPPNARRSGIQGTVEMDALIGLDGQVKYIRATKGPAELVPAALESARQWAYKPTLLNGKSCYVITRIDIHFTLTAR